MKTHMSDTVPELGEDSGDGHFPDSEENAPYTPSITKNLDCYKVSSFSNTILTAGCCSAIIFSL